jgi:hypothetical protein
LGDAETTRLQRLREFHGKLPEEHQPLRPRRTTAAAEARSADTY